MLLHWTIRSEHTYLCTPVMMSHPEQEPQEEGEQRAKRCYTAYASQESIDFCPLNDLNFPASYEQVIERFKKLQGEQAMEVMN